MKNKLIGFGLAVLVILVIAAGSGIFYVGQFAGWDYNDTGITNSAGQTIDQRATTAVTNSLIGANEKSKILRQPGERLRPRT